MSLSLGDKTAAKWGCAVLFIGLAISLAVALTVNSRNSTAVNEALQRTVEQISYQVLNRLTLYQYGLRGVRGMVVMAGEDEISRQTFGRYSLTREVAEEFPGARGFGFIRIVSPQQQASFILKAQQDSWPIFAIRQLTPHDNDRYVIQYIEPVESNLSAVGLDIGSEVQRREAADAAMLSGEVRLSGPITLVQATGKPLQSFLILLPIYHNGSTPLTPEARKATIFGWSYAPLVTNEVLSGLNLPLQAAQLTLSDVTQANQPIPFYTTTADDELTDSQYSVVKEILGRKWQFKVKAYPKLINGLNLNRASLVFAYGALFSVLLAALVLMWSMSVQRKQQVLAEQARRASMLEHSLDGIISYDLDGFITSWNRGAELLFGYKEPTTIGLRSTELIVPPEKAELEKGWFAKALAGEVILNQVSSHQCKDGMILSTSMTMLAIVGEHGDTVGISQTIRDITAQKDAELRILKLNESLEFKVANRTQELQQAVSENKALLKSINNQLISVVTNIDGVILDVNDYFCRISGFSREQLIGNNHSLLRSSEHDDVFWQNMWAQISSGNSWHGEICNIDKQGDTHWLDTVIGPVVDENGHIERFVALSTDITERKFAQIEKNKLGSLLTSVLDAASEMSIISTDENGIINIFNRGSEQLLGYSANELVGISSPALIHLPEEINARSIELSEQYGLVIEGFDVFVYKARMEGSETRNWTYVKKDGSHCQVSLSVTAIRDIDNNIVGYLGIAVDITQTLQQQEALVTASNHLRKAAEVAQLGMWTFNVSDSHLDWNDRMFTIYDHPLSLREEGLNYQHWIMRVHPDDVAMMEQQLNNVIDGQGKYDLIFRVLTTRGQVRYVQAAAEVERDKHDNVIRVIGINLDITEQREVEKTLRAAKQQADDANAAKSAFLANMSHEIRTPMNAVLGLLQLMRHTTMSPQQEDYIHKTQTAAKSLLGLLNDILDFSKIEAGKFQLDPEPCEIEVLMRELAVVLSANLSNRDVEVMFNLDPTIPSWLLIDKLRLQQVLINLAGNALKFTRHGQVIIGIECLESVENSKKLRFSVTDTGIGISKEQISRIFNGFEQAESSTTRRFGGTGLGLAISKRLVELMGAELLVTSQVDEGSCFWFDATFSVVPITTEVAIDIKGRRVLVVDDNRTTTEILQKILVDFGCSVDCAYSGAEAIDKCNQAHNAQLPFDVVLMDWNMPELNGIKTAKLLRASIQDLQGSIPAVIMLTAYGEEVFREDDKEHGAPFVHFLTKPVTSQLLAESISQVMSGKFMATSVKPIAQKRLQGLTILVVEDNQLNRQIADELLTLEGAKVVLAEGGVEGVALVTQSPQVFDIVIMDVQMPDMDGLEATRCIRKDPRFELLPILAMTANVSQSDRIECIAAGMNDHTGKPIDMNLLVPSILTLVGRELSELVVDNYSFSDDASDLLEPQILADQYVLDSLAKVLSRFGGNEVFFKKMAKGFEAEINKQLWHFDNAFTQQETSQLVAVSHSIKGVASNFGAKMLADFAAYLEVQFKQGSHKPWQIKQWQDKLALLTRLSVEQLAKYISEPLKNESLAVIKSAQDKPQNIELVQKQIMQLKEQLQHNNLDAMYAVDEIASSLSHHRCWAEFYEQVQTLDFEKALTLLAIIEAEVI
ncbi:PAS domain S-box protein [Shewanella sp. OMA3-2]|uniref:PAS domain S-box protein n=1 Tax=Shewanella sp. OMA3-2 TaxID=2908650 RepID=UPI001F1885ED|nr:PAS domain S-box protein [Shewanella sp. OMA3-2]UJF22544.1 PAS domain S-box protein [Shewanella sp. OMA3-2]